MAIKKPKTTTKTMRREKSLALPSFKNNIIKDLVVNDLNFSKLQGYLVYKVLSCKEI